MRALLIRGLDALNPLAEVAELVDALASGASIFTDVLVRLQSSVPIQLNQAVRCADIGYFGLIVNLSFRAEPIGF